jgi:hypothetical protein
MTSGASGDFKSNDFVLPRFHVAGETRIADWLTGRFGFNRAIIMRSNETNGTVPNVAPQPLKKISFSGSNTVQTVSPRCWFHFGRFSNDATVSEKWQRRY